MVGPGDTHRKWVLLHGDFLRGGGEASLSSEPKIGRSREDKQARWGNFPKDFW